MNVWELREYEKPFRRDFSRLGFAVAAMMTVWYAVTLLTAYALRRWMPALTEYPLTSWLVNDLALYLFGVPVFLLLLRKTERKAAPKSELSAGGWMLALLIGVGLMIASNLVSTVLMLGYQMITHRETDNAVQQMALNSPLWQNFVFSVVIAPIGEEFVFRRCLCDRLRRYGDITAILISAWMFGGFHGNLFQIVYGFLLGVLLAYVYLNTGRLRYSVLLHAALNFLCGFVPAVLLHGLDTAALSDPQVLLGDPALMVRMLMTAGYELLIFGLAIAGIVLLITMRRRFRFRQGEIFLPASRAVPVTFGNAGAIVLAVCFAAAIVYHLLA